VFVYFNVQIVRARPSNRYLYHLYAMDVAENLRNIGNYTLQLQAMLNESGGVTVVSGKHLPAHIVHFSITGMLQDCCLPLPTPPCGAGAPLFPPCPFTSSPFVLFTFPFLSLALPIFFFFLFSFVHLFPFYQNGPTLFPGRMSYEATEPGFSLLCLICVICIP